MRVLLLGGGGREHALAWKLAASPVVTLVATAPGNPGTAMFGPSIPIDPNDPIAVAGAAEDYDIVVIGPEAPLAAGVVDHLADKGIPAFGPTRAAAMLESSKGYAKEIMRRAEVSTAAAESFDDFSTARQYLAGVEPPFVVKADGLAGGKGVLVTDDRSEAIAWAQRILDAGERVLVEEFLDGPELSVFAMCNGSSAVPFGHARDHKRLDDGDRGPNTGGMGCFAPVAGVDSELIDDIMWNIVEPVVAAMAEEGTPYSGILYAGLALSSQGPKVIEFNCRFGDPEAEVLLPLLTSDLASLIAAAAQGAPMVTPRFSPRAALDVVLAAPGYPAAPRHGGIIDGVAEAAAQRDVLVFHAGTTQDDEGALRVAGGRVLNIVGMGTDMAAARAAAYRAVDSISFEGMQYRTDIGEST